jgi:hypothetical protein
VYKVHYISYGCNYYGFWSQNHKERFEAHLLADSFNTETSITGHTGFQELYTRFQKDTQIETSPAILVVGEYFAKDGYYTSPFNRKATIALFESLKTFAERENIPITIRTRLHDEYYDIACRYLSDHIRLSSPEVSLYEDLKNHDLILSVFSNVLHEGLILDKQVFQVNLLGFENYRDLAEKGLVHYADSTEKLMQILGQYRNKELPSLDFTLHREVYCNHCHYKPLTIAS